MAARPVAVIMLALAVTLASAPAAGAARNGPIGWTAQDAHGPILVESDSAGGAIRDLLAPGVNIGSGVFSPTGDRFAYHGHRGLEDRVFVAHLLGGRAGTREELLGAGLHQGFRISDWSPDGTRILYYYEDTLGRDDIPAQHLLNLVYTVPPFGSSPFLTAPAFVPFAGGSFFPDSRTVAVSATPRLLGGAIGGILLRVNTDTARVAPIATDVRLDGINGTPRDPAVSPDGSKIAYSLDGPPGALGADDLASLVVINADGSDRHVLTRGHRDTRPQWSPDGRMLTFQRQTVLSRDCGSSGACYYEYEVFVIGADGRGEANFSNAPPYNFAPDWRPARPRGVGQAQTAPLVTVLMSGASVPLAKGKTLSLQVVCPKGPRNCAGVSTLLAGRHVVVKKRFLLRAGRSRVLHARVKRKLLRAQARTALRLVTKAKGRRVRTRRVRLKRRSALTAACPATGRAGDALLFRGRLSAPGKRQARVLLAHLESATTGAVLDETVKTAANGSFALTAAPPTDGPWTMTVAWPGDTLAFGRAVGCTFVLRGPPVVQLSSPGEGATVVADTDVALQGAAGDTIDGKLGVAWSVDGAPAGSGSPLTTRFHALGRHVVTLSATNGAGISASQSVGIDVVPPATTPAIAITAPNDGADLPKQATTFTAQASDAYDGRLSGASVTWRDRYTPDAGPPHDDPLGSGEQVTATLYADAGGTQHTITATATNSAGTRSAASITVTAH